MNPSPSPYITVTLIEAWPDRVVHDVRSFTPGATLRDALASTGFAAAGDDTEELSTAMWGIWGKRVPLNTTLKDGDRIERYRPITADPKAARHHRASQQGYRWQGRTRRAVQARDNANDTSGKAIAYGASDNPHC